jgi:hypothetical protein
MAIALCLILPVMLAVAPFFIVCAFLEIRIARAIGLSRKGYFGGRRVNNHWVYEERHGDSLRTLLLEVENTEPGCWDMSFPTAEKWSASVPEWARARREEIAGRIAGRYERKRFHYPPDLKRD